jgi:hypothetical protein
MAAIAMSLLLLHLHQDTEREKGQFFLLSMGFFTKNIPTPSSPMEGPECTKKIISGNLRGDYDKNNSSRKHAERKIINDNSKVKVTGLIGDFDLFLSENTQHVCIETSDLD